MKKLVILSFSVLLLALSVFVVNAATFQGPPNGCSDPTGANCNLDGVIWNRATTAPQAQDASYYISGDTRTGGSARIGNGLQVDAGNVNVANEVIANYNKPSDIAKLNFLGDLELKTNKSIRIDQDGSASTLYIANYGLGDNPVNVNIQGTISVAKDQISTWSGTPNVSAPQFCLNGDCITSWPSAGGGGDITGIIPGTGILGGGSSGDVTVMVDDTRYINAQSNDTMNGRLIINGPAGSNALAIQGNFANDGIFSANNTDYWGYGIYGSAQYLGVRGQSSRSGGWGGVFGNSVGGSSRMSYLGGSSYSLQTTGYAYIGGTGNTLCLNNDCRSTWPSSGTTLPTCALNQILKWNGADWVCSVDIDTNSGGDLTSISVGAGLYVSGGAGPTPTIGMSSGYLLPQSCATGQAPVDNGSTWTCGNFGQGDLTGLTPGYGINISSPDGPVPFLSVNTAALDLRYVNETGDGSLDSRYVNDTSDTMSGNLTVNGALYLGGTGAKLYVNGSEALWFNGTYFSWGYGGSDNYFADYVGLGVTNPVYRLQLSTNSAAKPGSSSWTIYSDARLKNIEGDFSKGLDDITKLSPIKYHYKEGNGMDLPTDEEFVGLIAQDVQNIFPDAVKMNDKGYLTIDYNEIQYAQINAIKELKTENDELKSRVENLEERLEALENQ